MTEQKNASEPKGRPTPSRKQQEAQNRKPLVGDRSPEARAAAKAKLREERLRAREGMARGEEKYLPARDRGPQRAFIRDFIDSRFTAGELVMPTLFLVIIVSAIDSYVVQLTTLVAMWVLFILVGANATILGRKATKELAAKYGADKLEPGLRWYAAMRSIQMRPMRLPKPRVKRGQKI